MAWFFLFLAGLLEVGWAVGLKYTGRLHAPNPNAAHSHQHDRQPRTTGSIPEDPSVGNRLCDLDWCRNDRHGYLWDPSVGRGSDCVTARLHWANSGGHRWPQTRIARMMHTEISSWDAIFPAVACGARR
jgi:hypothetical protein